MMTSDFYNLKWLLYILKCRLYINKTFIVSKQIEEIIPVTVFLITSFSFHSPVGIFWFWYWIMYKQNLYEKKISSYFKISFNEH